MSKYCTNRLLIYCLFDPDGQVDDYASYFIKSIRKWVKHIIVVSNGKLKDTSRDILNDIELIERVNKGFDAGAWKDVIISLYNNDRLREYDSLMLVNDTFYGPLNSFDQMFIAMDEKSCDFWGITSHGAERHGKMQYPWHLQSYFMAFNRRCFSSDAFIDYWMHMPYYANLSDVVNKHERFFTQYLQNNGFTCSVYIDTRDLEQNPDSTSVQYLYAPLEMIRDRHCEVIKRKAFITNRGDKLRFTDGSELQACLEYIDLETNYDVSLIIKNLKRLYGNKRLMNEIGFCYVPSDIRLESISSKHIILAVFVTKNRYLYDAFCSIPLPKGISVKIYSNTTLYKDLRKDISTTYVTFYEGNLVNAYNKLLSDLGNHEDVDYIGVLSDTEWSDAEPDTLNRQLINTMLGNMLISKADFVTWTFENHSYLDLLVPFPMLTGNHYGKVMKGNLIQGSFWIKREVLSLFNSFRKKDPYSVIKNLIDNDKYDGLYGTLISPSFASRMLPAMLYMMQSKYADRKLLYKHSTRFNDDFILGKIYSGVSLRESFRYLIRYIKRLSQ